MGCQYLLLSAVCLSIKHSGCYVPTQNYQNCNAILKLELNSANYSPCNQYVHFPLIFCYHDDHFLHHLSTEYDDVKPFGIDTLTFFLSVRYLSFRSQIIHSQCNIVCYPTDPSISIICASLDTKWWLHWWGTIRFSPQQYMIAVPFVMSNTYRDRAEFTDDLFYLSTFWMMNVVS